MRGTFAALMEESNVARRLAALALFVGLTLFAAGCGGGERQDADEKEGDFQLSIVGADFPKQQSLAQRATLAIEVRNDGDEEAPNVALTVETAPPAGEAPRPFAQARKEPNLADPARPIWILDQGPRGGDTAYTNTWALGKLAPGQSKTFEWRVTAMKEGDYTVSYAAAPGLDGKARLADGSNASGSLKVNIEGRPSSARVDDDGKVVRIPPG